MLQAFDVSLCADTSEFDVEVRLEAETTSGISPTATLQKQGPVAATGHTQTRYEKYPELSLRRESGHPRKHRTDAPRKGNHGQHVLLSRTTYFWGAEFNRK